MEPLHLNGIDQPLTPFVLGTMTFGDNADIKAAGEMLELFLEAGGNGIDTANGYSGGRSESMLADLLRGRREQVVLATKIGIPHPDAAGAPPLSIDGIRRCVTASLHRLGTDHVDLLYLHQPDRTTPIAQTLTAIQELTGVRNDLRSGNRGVSPPPPLHSRHDRRVDLRVLVHHQRRTAIRGDRGGHGPALHSRRRRYRGTPRRRDQRHHHRTLMPHKRPAEVNTACTRPT